MSRQEHPDRIGPAALSAALDAMLPMERVVVPDGGNVNLYPGAFLRVPDPETAAWQWDTQYDAVFPRPAAAAATSAVLHAAEANA